MRKHLGRKKILLEMFFSHSFHNAAMPPAHSFAILPKKEGREDEMRFYFDTANDGLYIVKCTV